MNDQQGFSAAIRRGNCMFKGKVIQPAALALFKLGVGPLRQIGEVGGRGLPAEQPIFRITVYLCAVQIADHVHAVSRTRAKQA